MALFKNKFKTDSNRLKDWDYSNEAVYFITIATKNRECIFGSVEEGKMILNSNGQIVENELLKSIKIRKNWFFHNWVVMPNHIHLLIEIQNKNPVSNIKKENVEMHNLEMHSSASSSHPEISIKSELSKTHIVETHSSASNPSISTNVGKTHSSASLHDNPEPKLSRKPDSISSFIAIFKSVTTKQINGTETIWQSNYHDHIVRNYKRFEIIYDYIKNNPQTWDTDSINSNFQ